MTDLESLIERYWIWLEGSEHPVAIALMGGDHERLEIDEQWLEPSRVQPTVTPYTGLVWGPGGSLVFRRAVGCEECVEIWAKAPATSPPLWRGDDQSDRCAPDGDTSASPGTRTIPHPDSGAIDADGVEVFQHCEPSLRRRAELDALAADRGHNVRVEDVTHEWWHRRCVVVEIGDYTLNYSQGLVSTSASRMLPTIEVVKYWKTSECIGVGTDAIAAMDDACDWLRASRP